MNIKRKSWLLFGILILAMTFGISALIIGPVRADSSIFIVSPSGGDDTANIQTAFNDAIAAGPGSTVQLTSGKFYTNAIIVEGFYGTFKGAGKGSTKIDVLKGLDDTLEGVVGPVGPYLFSFIGGDVCISDLIFDITPYMPAEPWEDPEVPSYDIVSIILLTGETNSRIENNKFIGHEGTLVNPLEKSFNVRVGVEYHFGTGKHTITKCKFKSLWGGISAFGLTDVEMKITSNSIKKGNFGIINMDNSNSKFEISQNYIETMFIYGIWAWQIGVIAPPSPCQWCITYNTIKASNLGEGIALQDHAEAIEAVVSYNEVTLDHTIWGGIWTFGLQDALIYKNTIHGKGSYGIGCDFINHCLIIGNHISNKENNGMYLYTSSQNLILGNYISHNGGWGLYMDDSNDNYIAGNLFYKNGLGNIFDNGNNEYGWNWEF
ncbi:MAG: right-handed parallel beta-helix repeat-containing protein [Promethearchaeota archaeon]